MPPPPDARSWTTYTHPTDYQILDRLPELQRAVWIHREHDGMELLLIREDRLLREYASCAALLRFARPLMGDVWRGRQAELPAGRKLDATGRVTPIDATGWTDRWERIAKQTGLSP